MKQADQQPWILSLRAKAKKLDFKLKLSRILPLCKISPFSIQFKLQNYVFEIKSRPRSTFSFKPKSLKLKLLQIFRKFRCKRTKNKGILRSWCARKNFFIRKRKTRIWLWVLLFAMVGSFVILRLSYYYLGARFVWKCLWWASYYAAPYRLFNQFLKVIYNEICKSLTS